MKRKIPSPIDQLNALLAATAGQAAPERWRAYFQPVPGLSEGLPVPILGIMVLIWQLRAREMEQKYPLDTVENRLDFIAWCAVHGGSEYQALREADAFWEALGKPAAPPGDSLPTDDAGHAISWLMVLLQRQRGDLSIDLNTPTGRKQMLAWYILHGQKELPYFTRPFQPWQTDYLFAESRIPGLNRLHEVLYDALPRIQQAFALPAARQQYAAWLKNYLCNETSLVKKLCAAWASGPGEGEYPGGTDATDETASTQPSTSTQADPHPPGINVVGYIFGQLGIGEDARMAAKSLLTTDVPTTLVDFPPGKEIPQNDRSMAAHVSSTHRYATNLFCLTALETGRFFAERGMTALQGRRNIGYWPWELPKFPTQWRHLISLVDEIWVSTSYTQAGLDGISPVPVRVMPMAVEMADVSNKTRADFGLPPEAKLFIFAFDLQSSATRKNPIACVEAFSKAFPLQAKNALSADQVGLVVKVHPSAEHDPNWKLLKRLQAKDARIHLIDETLSKPDLMALYQCCDCFVSLHRAEGFGRGIAEAMLLGKPVITTGFSGNLDFTRPDNALLVKHRLLKLAPGDYLHGEGQSWADPDIADAAQRMRAVVDQSEQIELLATRGQQFVANHHALHGVGQRYQAVLQQAGQLATTPKAQPRTKPPAQRRATRQRDSALAS